MATNKQTIIITISERGSGTVLDQLEVFAESAAKAVEQITNSIENNHWTDESDFDAWIHERDHQTDPENIYNLPGIQQSIEEDRR